MKNLFKKISRLWNPKGPPNRNAPAPSPEAVVPPGSGWKAILETEPKLWQKARDEARGPRVLIGTSMGGFNHAAVLESTLATALTLRGAQVEVLLCDSYLPACQLTKITSLPTPQFLASRPMPRCGNCEHQGRESFSPLGLPLRFYSQLVTPEEAETAKKMAAEFDPNLITADYRRDGVAVGEHALAGALRYFARGDFDGEPQSDQVRQRYLEAALLSVYALERLLKQGQYEVAVFNHGLYVPQGLIVDVCRKHNVEVVTWNAAYRKHRFIFSRGDTYHHTMITEPVSDWEDLEWTPPREKETMDYLKSRWQGTQDWIWFHERPEENVNKIATELGLDLTKPVIGLLTNVMWDAVLHYKSNAFPSMLDWVKQTIAHFAKTPDRQLVIRVHPAEVRGLTPSRQLLVPEVYKAFPTLPSNVFLIPPESRISTYALMEPCDSVIIYNTKTGIELSSLGIPVIVAGEAWIRNKGFSLDASSPEEYFQILDQLPLKSRLTPEQTLRARKYAYHFFCRRMIPLPFIGTKSESSGAALQVEICNLRELSAGRFAGLDVICDGILKGEKFICPDADQTASLAA